VSFNSVKKFEQEVADFFGAKYAVATDCCTHAIELCLRYLNPKSVSIPTRTYISVPFTLLKLGIPWSWDDNEWSEYYKIGNTPIVDAAVCWKKGAYVPQTFMCLSFQFKKHLSLGRGGMILTNNQEAAQYLKKMSYDGRDPDIPWRDQDISCVGYHYYMTPETAEKGLERVGEAKRTPPHKWEHTDWPDLRKMKVFNN
jgi:dTDP-4-amino-4,6-dideoxygalactose transaminase